MMVKKTKWRMRGRAEGLSESVSVQDDRNLRTRLENPRGCRHTWHKKGYGCAVGHLWATVAQIQTLLLWRQQRSQSAHIYDHKPIVHVCSMLGFVL